MLNQVILVGRIRELKNEELTVAITRSYKNEKGQYDTDDVKVIIEGKLAENTNEYCHKGDIIGVKGHLGKHNRVYADKLTFLSTAKQKD